MNKTSPPILMCWYIRLYTSAALICWSADIFLSLSPFFSSSPQSKLHILAKSLIVYIVHVVAYDCCVWLLIVKVNIVCVWLCTMVGGRHHCCVFPIDAQHSPNMLANTFLNPISQLNFSTVFPNWNSQLYFPIEFLNCISQLNFSTVFPNRFSQLYFPIDFLNCIFQFNFSITYLICIT